MLTEKFDFLHEFKESGFICPFIVWSRSNQKYINHVYILSNEHSIVYLTCMVFEKSLPILTGEQWFFFELLLYLSLLYDICVKVLNVLFNRHPINKSVPLSNTWCICSFNFPGDTQSISMNSPRNYNILSQTYIHK